MRARRDAALRLLKSILVASIVIPVAIFSYASWVNYRSALAHADEELNASLNILSQHASGVFQSVQLAFTAVDAILGHLTDDQIKTSQEALHLAHAMRELLVVVAQLAMLSGMPTTCPSRAFARRAVARKNHQRKSASRNPRMLRGSRKYRKSCAGTTSAAAC